MKKKKKKKKKKDDAKVELLIKRRRCHTKKPEMLCFGKEHEEDEEGKPIVLGHEVKLNN